ncbi:MAG: ATP-binding protein [Acidobacteriota bacterium]
MISALRRTKRDGHESSWPLVSLLLLVVLVPTVGVLFFMLQAMSNERLAVRQKLSDVYRAELQALQSEHGEAWRARLEALDALPAGVEAGAGQAFAATLDPPLGADAAVLYDADRRAAYPGPPRLGPAQGAAVGPLWRSAQELEAAGRLDAAEAAYRELAQNAATIDAEAQALLARARCLARLGRVDEAMALWVDELGQPRFAGAVDRQGRWIVPSARLRALELMDGGDDSELAADLVSALAGALRSYAPAPGDAPVEGATALPAAQRRFLMTRLTALVAEEPRWVAEPVIFDTLPAEELAAEYLDAEVAPPVPSVLHPASLGSAEAGVWHLASADGRVVVLYRAETLQKLFRRQVAGGREPAGATVELVPPGSERDDPFTVELPAAPPFDGWRLVLRPRDQELFATAASQRIDAYRVTGVLVVVTILAAVLWAARIVRRQQRLTRLKNDLVATVSHELKTPLASMRLLVDSLLDGDADDPTRTREYLELIAQENVRLSRLVESFLTFATLQQGEPGLSMTRLDPGRVVEAARVAAVERFRDDDCTLEVEVADDLPEILGQHDALVTVLLNLLDNACKYGEASEGGDDQAPIRLRAFRWDDEVCFEVEDEGIGLASHQVARIFDRFYQVDQRLSRRGGGVGLGLSIVQRIVKAHGGSIDIESAPNEGSVFRVRIPTAGDEHDD